MKKQLLTLLTLIWALAGVAQNNALKGFIYDKSNGEPILFANIYLKGTKYGASTDVNGFYYIDKIPDGNYTIEVRFLGYKTHQQSVSLSNGAAVKTDIYLQKSTERLADVIVSARKKARKTEVNMSVVKLTPKQITLMPSVGAEPDLAQAIQTLPGVVFTGDQGGQMYIRGGSPVQNQVILDGMTIYQAFHSVGFYSIFETDIIGNADIYTGGFNAQYGGRVSSIMDISLKDGNKRKTKGKIALNTFGANFLLQGPFVKMSQDNSNALTYVLYGKTSYMEQSSKSLYSYLDRGLPFSYNDIYSKITYSTKMGSKISLFGFNFRDKVDFKSLSTYKWNQWGLGTKIVIVPDNVPMIMSVRSSFSDYKINLNNHDSHTRESGINGFNFNMNFHYFKGRNTMDYGIDMGGGKTYFEFTNAVSNKITTSDNTTQIAGYFKPKFILNNWVFEPGLRLQYYVSLGEISIEPRLAVKFNATEKFRMKLAGGLYSQNLIAGTSDRDVVNLFYAYLSTPKNTPKTFMGNKLSHKLQKGRHLILGFEYDINSYFDINVEAYIKDFNQLTNLNRNKMFNDDSQNADEPDLLKKDFIIEKGKAYGLDFVLNYKNKGFKFWAVYSLGKVDRTDEYQTYQTHFDRRHNVNLISSYQWGKKHTWEISLRWNYGSAFPFTPVKGYYQQLVLDNNYNPNVSNTNGQLGILYGDINSFRLSDYHRLDLSIKKNFKIGQHQLLTLSATLSNVYDRKNIFYVDNIENEKIYQLPILPSFGLIYKF